jgi:hypothetical protein
LLVLAVACSGGGSTGASRDDFASVTGADVIDATKDARTAVLAAHSEPDGLDLRLSFDFRRNRALAAWRTPAGDDVEARTIGDTSYVSQGGRWVPVSETPGDVAFDLGSNAFHGQLAWLQLVDAPVRPSGVHRLADGTTVATYRADVATKDANEAIDVAQPADARSPALEGTTITITFTADLQHRLRSLTVHYRADGRDRTFTANVRSFGERVDIDAPTLSG